MPSVVSTLPCPVLMFRTNRLLSRTSRAWLRSGDVSSSDVIGGALTNRHDGALSSHSTRFAPSSPVSLLSSPLKVTSLKEAGKPLPASGCPMARYIASRETFMVKGRCLHTFAGNYDELPTVVPIT